jgi:hypothetical protein
MLEVIPSGFEARRRRGAEFALSLRVAGQFLSSFGNAALCARYPLVGTAMSMAGGVVATMAGKTYTSLAECESTPRHHQSASSSSTLEFNGRSCSVQYKRGDAPFGFGSLVIRPRWSDIPTKSDFAQVLGFVDKFACQRRSDINDRFISYFDTRLMVWPSMCTLPQVVSLFREQPPSMFLRDHTIGIAILHHDSRWLGMLITYLSELVAILLQPTIMPVFATSCEAADHLLLNQLSNKPASLVSVV